VKNPRSHVRTEWPGPGSRQGHGPDAAWAGITGRTWCTIGLVAALLAGGCQTVHQVTIDAISNPRKQIGQSYELEVIDPSGGVDVELQAMAVATLKETLAARGLYEAPRGVKPDSIITYTYGVGQGHINIVTEQNTNVLLGPMLTTIPTTNSKAVVVFDKFIELSAHEAVTTPDPNRPATPARKGEEMWNVKASIVDSKNTLAPYLAALGSSCIDYIGENSGKELHFKVEDKLAKATLKQRSKPVAAPAPPPAAK
jgi:hypothetical protein